jgi:hypothetical protein
MPSFLKFVLIWVRLIPAPLVEKLVFGVLEHASASTKTEIDDKVVKQIKEIYSATRKG